MIIEEGRKVYKCMPDCGEVFTSESGVLGHRDFLEDNLAEKGKHKLFEHTVFLNGKHIVYAKCSRKKNGNRKS